MLPPKKTPSVPEKTLGCRAPDALFVEIDNLVTAKTARTGKRATRTQIMLLAYQYGLPLVRQHIAADVQQSATRMQHKTEPERIAAAAVDLVKRGFQSMQDDLAALPASSF